MVKCRNQLDSVLPIVSEYPLCEDTWSDFGRDAKISLDEHPALGSL